MLLHSAPLKPTDNRLCGAALPRLCPVISPEAASVASFLTAHYNIYNSQMKEEQLWIGKIKWEHGILEYWFTFEYDYRDRWCGQCSEVKPENCHYVVETIQQNTLEPRAVTWFSSSPLWRHYSSSGWWSCSMSVIRRSGTRGDNLTQDARDMRDSNGLYLQTPSLCM